MKASNKAFLDFATCEACRFAIEGLCKRAAASDLAQAKKGKK